MTWTARPVDIRYKQGRQRLQDRYTAVSRLPDASRLAYLRGPEQIVTELQVRDLWEAAIENPIQSAETANNIYIHVPFCKSICNFCNYERLRPSHPDLLEAWLQRVIESMTTLGPVVSELAWGTVYIGGGTPSTLPAKMLRRLFDAIDTHLNVRPDAQRSFEFDPLVMSGARVDVLAEYGFNHFSFGIQTLDPEVNKAHNRGFQNRDTVAKRFQELYSRDLYDVACDFLLGLAGTTPESILADIDWVLSEHKPLHVDVFQISPTPEYVALHFGGEIDAFWKHIEPFQEQAPSALKEIAERNGYKVNIDSGHRYVMKRIGYPEGFVRPSATCYSYNQLVSEAKRPMHLLGFGPSARSQVFGHAAYQCKDPSDSLCDEPAHYAGHLLSMDDEVRTYLVHQLRDTNEIDREKFLCTFGVDVTEAIPMVMNTWAEEALVEVTPERVVFTKQSRLERLQTLLWMVPEAHLEHEIARRQRLDLTPDGVLRLSGELETGQMLADNHQYRGIDRQGRVLIHTPDRMEMIFRVAPGLEDGAELRLVLESRPPAEKDRRIALTRAMAQVRGVLRSNAAL
jgi:coproporphyrinogen III oxidase-like Fe-S oxidoreductase